MTLATVNKCMPETPWCNKERGKMIQSERTLIWEDEDENETRESRNGVDQCLHLWIKLYLKVFRLFT